MPLPGASRPSRCAALSNSFRPDWPWRPARRLTGRGPSLTYSFFRREPAAWRGVLTPASTEPDTADLAEQHGSETTVINWTERLCCSQCDARDADFSSSVAPLKLEFILGGKTPRCSGPRLLLGSRQCGGDQEERDDMRTISIASRLGIAVAAVAGVLAFAQPGPLAARKLSVKRSDTMFVPT